MILEKIRIQLEMVNSKFNNKIKQTQQSMNKLNSQVYKQNMNMQKMTGAQKAAEAQMTSFREQSYGFSRVMGMSMDRFKAFNQQGYKFNTIGGRTANRLRKMTHGMRGFRMEMLGVMFFGMSLTRIMSGLMGRSLEWTGVMDVLSTALGILFLPVAMQLLDWALRFLDWVGNLSESQKKMIGTIVLVIGAFGALLTIIGTLALGVGSIIQVFGGFSSIVSPFAVAGKAIAAVFGGISVSILAVIAVIAVVLVGMFIAWKNNFLGMKKVVTTFVDGIKQWFGGIIDVFKGIFLVIKGIFLGDWEIIWEGVKKLFQGGMNMTIGIIKATVAAIGAVLIGIVQIVWNIIKLVAAPFVWLYEYLVGHSLIPDMINEIIDWFAGLPGRIWNAIKGVGKMVADAFTGMIPDWMLKIFKGGGNFLVNTSNKVGKIFGFAEGGVVPGPRGAAMPAIVHGGETVIPAGASIAPSVNQTITINASISSDYDVRRLADQLNRYWANDTTKMRKNR